MRIIWVVLLVSAAFLSLYGVSNGRLQGDVKMRMVRLQSKTRQVQQTDENNDSKQETAEPIPIEHEKGGAVCASNMIGHWCWKRGTDLKNASALVILGKHGGYEDPVAALTDAGYAVWKRNTGCSDDACKVYDNAGVEITRRNKASLRAFGDAWGYLGYLADASPARPVFNDLIFLSSPAFSSLGAELPEIEKKLKEFRRTGRLTPIDADATASPVSVDFLEKYNELFGVSLPPDSSTLTIRQFILPGSCLSKFKPEYFRKVFTMHVASGNQDAAFLHRLWGLLFKGVVRAHTAPLHPSSSENVFMMSWNAVGFWAWDPSAPHVQHTLAVIGGSTVHPTTELVRRGMKVWKVRKNCREHHLALWGQQYIGDLSNVCTESWGYLQYLADPDVAKATADYVVFIHGHHEAWHQPGDIGVVIQEAVQCAEVRKAYTPLVIYDITKYWVRGWGNDGTASKWISMWNSALGKAPTSQMVPNNVKNLHAWAAASFVVPQSAITKHPPSFYQLALKEKATKGRQGLTGFFFEYTWHLFFGMAPVISPEDLKIPQCPNMLYAINHPKFIRQKAAKIARMEKSLADLTSL
eukprot:TRINITY_DN9001_c0_g1_i1.p1 TRINITY_DN9001_c0_g1~~TRINITY_DN9001_c0_g1_i1.p1  ORF type:complete len:581 (+),score=80.68 TRINITY_DN9001_c0_g1_i1:46-1788(+)